MMSSRKNSAKGGNDPAFGCHASVDALVVPALCLDGAKQNQINRESIRYLEPI
jgi:hypothetical protein